MEASHRRESTGEAIDPLPLLLRWSRISWAGVGTVSVVARRRELVAGGGIAPALAAAARAATPIPNHPTPGLIRVCPRA